MAKRVRSQFWVVSTHALTTGMAVPFLAAMIALSLIVPLGIEGLPRFLVSRACDSAGYIGGAYVSLSFLRRSTVINHPVQCTKPAVVVFVILELFTVAGRLMAQKSSSPLAAAEIIAFYTIMAVAVAMITQKKFADWEAALS